MELLDGELRALDLAVLCSICGAPFDVPLLLKACGHSFCSGCIRQNLAYQERSGPPSCPLCRAPCDARDLHPNPALREVVASFVAARPQLLALSKQPASLPAEQQQQRPCRQSSRKRLRDRQQHFGGSAGAEAAPPTDGRNGRRRTRSSSLAAAAASGMQADPSCEEVDLASPTCSEPEWSSATDASICSQDSEASGSSSGDERSRNRQKRPARPLASAVATAHQQPEHLRQQKSSATGTPAGFVRCPVCSKAVPSFYINSHVDLCLAGGDTANKQPKPSMPAAAAGPSNVQEAAGAEAAGPFEPLAVPSKLVPSLASEKSLRNLLKKYGLPTDGKKKDLLERYQKLRLAVEMANDKQERTSYPRLAKRVMQQERQKAAAHLLLSGTAGKKLVQAEVPAAAAPAPTAAPGNASETNPPGLTLPGATFKQLIAATRARDAARKAARQAAALADQQRQREQQREQQQEQQREQQQGRSTADAEVSGEDAGLWDDQLPLSQAQQPPDWHQRLRRQQQENSQAHNGQRSRLAGSCHDQQQATATALAAPQPGSD